MQTYRPAFHTWTVDGKPFVDPHMAEDSEGLYYLAADADKRIAELSIALKTYGGHKEECDYIIDFLPCSCGFEALRLSL